MLLIAKSQCMHTHFSRNFLTSVIWHIKHSQNNTIAIRNAINFYVNKVERKTFFNFFFKARIYFVF